MFVLETPTKVRVLDVRVLSQKDRKPDEQPGAQLLLQATLGIGVLAMFDGFLPGMLYRKAGGGHHGRGIQGQARRQRPQPVPEERRQDRRRDPHRGPAHRPARDHRSALD